MRSTHQSGRKTTLLYLLGILFCVILVTFAVVSKVAAYYPHNDAARSITSTKVWQHHAAVIVDAPPVQADAPALFLFAFAFTVLATAARASAWMQTAAGSTPALPLCFSRAHAIRPPPLT